MKLSIAKAELQKGLGRIQSIVEKRNTMPILANVLLEARKQGREGMLDLAATDLEVAIRGSQPAQVEKAGRVTASAKKLYEIVRELPDETVRIEATGGLLSDDPLRARRVHARGRLRRGVSDTAEPRAR